MKTQLLILFSTLTIFFFPSKLIAQLSISPDIPGLYSFGNDYCQNFPQPFGFHLNGTVPNHTYVWNQDNYSPFPNSGNIIETFIGNGTSQYFIPGYAFSCVRLIVHEYDQNMLEVNTAIFHLGSNTYPDIPLYVTTTNCPNLLVPPEYDSNVLPGRWSMWYKDGIASGISNTLLSDPDSGMWQYKLKLACGDTIATNPYQITTRIPVVSANGATTICTGETTTLSVQPGFKNYQWLRNGTPIPGANTNSYNATLSGVYTLNAGNYSSNGTTCYRLSNNSITVTVQNGAFITAYDTAKCNGDSIMLQCTSANSYAWYRNGLIIPNSVTQSIYVKTSGDYKAITTGLACNTSTIKHVTFYINATVSISPSGSTTFCKGNGVTLNASGTNINSYKWTKGGIAISNANSSSVFISNSGTYRCIVTNSLGCSKTSSSIILTTNSTSTLPSKTITIQPGSSGIDCYVESAPNPGYTNYPNTPFLEVSNFYKYFRTAGRALFNFDLSSLPHGLPVVGVTLKLYIDSVANWVNANQYLIVRSNTTGWTETTAGFPATSDYMSVIIPHDSIAKNVYVKANMMDLLNYWNTNPANYFGITVQMNETVSVPVGLLRIASGDHTTASWRPKLTITYSYADNIPNGPATFCNGDSVQLSTNAGLFTYQWYKNNVAIAGATGSAYTAKTTGAYYVTITNASGCSVASSIQNITVIALPTATITPLGPTTFCNGDSVQLQAGTGAGLVYQWLKGGVPIINTFGSIYTAKTAGTYRVRITNSSGCSKTSGTVVISVPCRIEIKNQVPEISVFPNPTTDNFIIQTSDGTPVYNLRVYDTAGKLVEEFPELKSGSEIGTNWPKGVYLYKTDLPSELTKRFIKM